MTHRQVSPVPSYRRDMRRARDRINSFPAYRLPTRFWIIEYADQGEGLPLLVSHGVLGCHVDTVDSWWAGLTGPGFRVIGPSRFGYSGSTLPAGATLADQADAYALLLDHLGVDRAAVIAFSARSGSVLKLARRHPRARHRADPCLLPARRRDHPRQGIRASSPARLQRRPDLLALQAAHASCLRPDDGHAQGLPAPAARTTTVTAGLNKLFPLKPRREGAVFDGFVSNLATDRFPSSN